MDEWLSIAEIADKIGIPDNTARRYAGKFSDFMQSKTYGRTKKYTPDAIQVIERVSQLYQSGKSTDEIYELLQREKPIVVEVEEEERPSLFVQPYEVMEEFRRTNSLILQTMQQVSEAVETMTAQQQELAESRRKIDELKDMVRERETREKELLQRIAQIEEAQKRPWWKLWGK